MLDSMAEEFMIEAQELFDESESSLINIDNGEDFLENYNAVFRCFHSLKGAAGMFELKELQAHMHKIEDMFEREKDVRSIAKDKIDFYLDAIDHAKAVLNNQSPDEFDYQRCNEQKSEAKKGEKKVVEKTLEQEVVEQSLNKKESDLGTIYIVDDEEMICELISEMLEDYGFNTKSFTEAKVLLEALKDEKPDLIFSDLMMPEIDGLELIKSLTELKLNIPVCIISGHITKERLMESLNYGVKGFLEKPFEDSQVISLAKNVIEREKTIKLLNKSINFILYQFHDIDEYLKANKKDNIRKAFKEELDKILSQRDKLL